MESQRTEISSLGEFGLIDRISAQFNNEQKSTLKGIGDDAAVLKNGQEITLVSTDMLIEGIHFDLTYVPLMHLGYKSVVVNLSDIYAMNGMPTHITISVALSNRFPVEAVDEFYKGVAIACKKYNVDMVGGDTSSSLKGFIISVTALGKAVTEEHISYRNGARVGDLVCVSGDLGGAFLGLQLLEREKQVFKEDPNIKPDFEGQTYLLQRQLRPEARKDIIELFNELLIVPTSMIDISDGLSSEILHLCKQSNTGCLIKEENIPIHESTYNKALDFNIDPMTCVLNGGEDYELLFTIRPEDETKLTNEHDISVIGEITEAGTGRRLMTKGGNYHNITAQGWNQFDQNNTNPN